MNTALVVAGLVAGLVAASVRPRAPEPPEQGPQQDRQADLDRQGEDVERLERVADQTVDGLDHQPPHQRVEQERRDRSQHQ